LNFHGVEVADRPVMLPSSFCCAVAVAFYLQFFDAVTEKLGLFIIHLYSSRKMTALKK